MLQQLRLEEQTLVNSQAEFPARYMAACNLRSLAEKQPDDLGMDTIRHLEKLMHDPRLLNQRQSYFLFREAAHAMTAVIKSGRPSALVGLALSSLQRLLRTATGSSHQACAEAIGCLPVLLKFPDLPQNERQPIIPTVSLQEIAVRSGCTVTGNNPRFLGRSIFFPFLNVQKLLVLKFARRDDPPEHLFNETDWMRKLVHCMAGFPGRFEIPAPLCLNGCTVFRIKDLPFATPASLHAHPEHIAIAFTIPAGYFAYANEPCHYDQPAQFMAVMARNARLFGFLAAQGIIHTAPIPLFHNRVQRHRREDQGLYDWPRGGRLDQWLESCQHPNFGLTGIRDFEHFHRISGHGERLFWHLGAHILSLLLVAASYFRNRQKDLRGLNPDQKPVDARHLFDENFLAKLISDTLLSYYQGFAGYPYHGEMPFDVHRLTRRMIEEMGVDRHMEEILRQVDQQQMDDQEFRLFLTRRGWPSHAAATTLKGASDIVLLTGPHLGGFNQGISIPELIEATAAMAATCVLGRFAASCDPSITWN